MLKEYARFGCIGPNLKKEIGRKMTKAIESEPLDGFCLQSEEWSLIDHSFFIDNCCENPRKKRPYNYRNHRNENICHRILTF